MTATEIVSKLRGIDEWIDSLGDTEEPDDATTETRRTLIETLKRQFGVSYQNILEAEKVRAEYARSDEFSATKCGILFSRRGRPKNPLITRLMAEGVSRRTAFRRLKAKRKAQLAKAARMGIARDHLNQHPDGFHPTPPRGARALLARESFKGVVWECACGDGAISRILEAAGYEVVSTDLMDRGYGRGGHDFLADNATLADHIITNPPYGPERGLAAKFVAHALTRIRPGGTVCMLLRTNWEAPQAHQHLMARCCRKYTFSRRLKMHRGGYAGKKHSPQLDVSWYVFSNEHTGPTRTEMLPPDCGDWPQGPGVV